MCEIIILFNLLGEFQDTIVIFFKWTFLAIFAHCAFIQTQVKICKSVLVEILVDPETLP